jgi:hypothetical protein
VGQGSPGLERWRQLYEVAERVRVLAPWQWMDEAQVFGVRPAGGDIAFVSVMGLLGQHFAISAYLGAEGLSGFLALEEADDSEDAGDRLLEIPQLQASFEARRALQKQDLETIRALGLAPRGRAWPLFRSFRPGYVPWFVSDDEITLLVTILEQVLDLAPRLEEDPELLTLPGDDAFLVRAPDPAGGGWRDEVVTVAPPAPRGIPFAIETADLATLARLPRSASAIEVDLFRFPAAVEEGPRPFYPYALLLADARGGTILGVDLLSPVESLPTMWGQVPAKITRQLIAAGRAPREMRARSELVLQLLEPLAAKAGFTLRRSTSLPSADAARRGMLQTLVGD